MTHTVEDVRAAECWEQVMEVALPWDMTSKDPSKNFGRHCSDIGFILKGKRGAVQWRAMSNVYLPHDQLDMLLREKIHLGMTKFDLSTAPGGIYGTDVGYHSHVPMYSGQDIIQESCPYLGGKPCYYDGSGLQAIDWADEILSVRGARPETVLWPKLEQYYVDTFYNDVTPMTLSMMMRALGLCIEDKEGKPDGV